MFFIQKTFLFFCTITFIKAVSLKIDGLIDLGPNWSYEYRILSPGEAVNRDVARARLVKSNHEPEDKPHQRNDPQEDERMRKDEERLTKAEERLRKEAAELRKTVHHEAHPEHEKHRDDHKIHDTHKTLAETFDKLKALKNEELALHREPRKSERDRNKKRTRDTDEFEDKKMTPKQVTYSSNSEDSSSLFDSDEATTPKQGTRFDMYDFTTTRKPKNRPRDSYESYTKKHKEKHGLVNEDAASFIDETHDKIDKIPIKREQLNKTSTVPNKNITISIQTVRILVTNATLPTTTDVTTVRTGEIYGDAHKVKDDAKIIDFTNHLYKQTLKVFDVVKEKTGQYHVKKQIDELAKSYEDKFKEFLADTSTQKIKTRLGTQKVILNTIEMSNRILKRLINFMIGDMDKKGVLRHNVATANIFQKEVEKEQNLELGHACKKFGICRTGRGFPEFITEVLTILLRCDDRKFKQSIDALTEVVKNTNYNKALEGHTERKLKAGIDKVEMLPVETLRPMFMIIKNIITNKNKPLIVNNVSASRRVNSTLAFLEIIDLLDQKMPRNESNALEWIDIENSLKDYADSKRYDVQEIMEVILKHLKKTLRSLDKASQKIVSKNLNIIF